MPGLPLFQSASHIDDIWFHEIEGGMLRRFLRKPYSYLDVFVEEAQPCPREAMTLLFRFLDEVEGQESGLVQNEFRFLCQGITGGNTVIATYREWNAIGTFLRDPNNEAEDLPGHLETLRGTVPSGLIDFLKETLPSLTTTQLPGVRDETKAARFNGVHFQWDEATTNAVGRKRAFAHAHLGVSDPVRRDNLTLLSVRPDAFLKQLHKEHKFRIRRVNGTPQEEPIQMMVVIPEKLKGLEVLHQYSAPARDLQPKRADEEPPAGTCPPCCKMTGYVTNEPDPATGQMVQAFYTETILYDCYFSCPEPQP